jgi:hypothetical protein
MLWNLPKLHGTTRTPTPSWVTIRLNIYHLKEDGGEKKNVATKNPEKTKELKALLESLKHRQQICKR